MTRADHFEAGAREAAAHFGEFTPSRILDQGGSLGGEAGGSEFVAYPKQFAGMGGGALMATVSGAPVFEFDTEEEAAQFCALTVPA